MFGVIELFSPRLDDLISGSSDVDASDNVPCVGRGLQDL
jgi:hypothetical protein